MNIFGWLKRSKMKREIIVNVEKLETRVAVIENGRLEEYMVEHPEEERLVGSVFKGRVQNLENDLQAAFVDIGLKKNAFLHYWDMTPDADTLLDDEEDDGGDADRRLRVLRPLRDDRGEQPLVPPRLLQLCHPSPLVRRTHQSRQPQR